MTGRIDHAATAESRLSLAVNDNREEFVPVAQVHATLALVEQQRIANLIALADMAEHEFGAYAGHAGPFGTIFDRPETEHGNMRLKPEIAAALGVVQ